MILCLVGPSGSGKSAICEEALKTNPLIFGKVRTATTRVKRPNEKDDAYYFYSEKEFEDKMKAGEFLETSNYAGQFYGTPISSVQEIISNGKIALVPIDINGAMKYKTHFGNDAILVFIHRDKDTIIRAIVERDIPVAEKARRIMQLDDEYNLINHCDRCIVNSRSLEDAVDVLKLFAK
jgi:guanylate kinase